MFDLEAISDRVARHGRVARVVIAQVKGSAPREVGASMLVWADDQSGTIGGGALEYEAASTARAVLATGAPRVTRHPLGPALGQCCGGAVTLVTEVFAADDLKPLQRAPYHLRRIEGAADQPFAVKRDIAAHRASGTLPKTQLSAGWLLEPLSQAQRPLWVWGAGHVGRMMISTFAPLPDFQITWIDTAQDRFPDAQPKHITQLIAANPAQLVPHAPPNAEHLILTYSHALDLELCHQMLLHGFGFAGLIGSHSKWVRFRKRLADLGHSAEHISRITCPIGDPSLGKHPQAIAIGVAAKLLKPPVETWARRDRTA